MLPHVWINLRLAPHWLQIGPGLKWFSQLQFFSFLPIPPMLPNSLRIPKHEDIH